MGAWIANNILELGLLTFLLACSAFFSGSETALFSLKREQIRALENKPTRAGDCILVLLRDPRLLLATVLLGNMVVNILFYSVSFQMLQGATKLSPWAAGALGVASLALVIVFGEVGPKGLAIAHPEGFARVIAIPLILVQKVLRPFALLCVRLLRAMTGWVRRFAPQEPYIHADELKMLVEMAERQQVLDAPTRSMIQDVVDIGQTRVKQIMVPRVDMAVFPIASGRERFLRLFREKPHKRYLCYAGSPDDIESVLFTRDVLLAPHADLRELLRPAAFVPETKTVESLLHLFRLQGMDFAVVVDEYGGTAGMVTIEDVIEEIFGEIADESDTVGTEVRESPDGSYLLEGDLSLATWREVFGHDLPSANVDTVGGIVTALLGHMPKVGDTVTFQNIEFRVESMRGRRVESVRLRLLPEEDAP